LNINSIKYTFIYAKYLISHEHIFYPLKSEVIGRCGGEEKTIDHIEPSQLNVKKKHLLNIHASLKFSSEGTGVLVFYVY